MTCDIKSARRKVRDANFAAAGRAWSPPQTYTHPISDRRRWPARIVIGRISGPLSSHCSPRAALKCTYRGDSMTRDRPAALRVRMQRPRRGIMARQAQRVQLVIAQHTVADHGATEAAAGGNASVEEMVDFVVGDGAAHAILQHYAGSHHVHVACRRGGSAEAGVLYCRYAEGGNAACWRCCVVALHGGTYTYEN